MTGDEREKLAIRTYLINNFVSGHDLSVQPKFAERTRLRSRAERLSSRVKSTEDNYFPLCRAAIVLVAIGASISVWRLACESWAFRQT